MMPASFRGVACGAVMVLGSCGEAISDADRWSGTWQRPTGEVVRALAMNRIAGCGEFYQKESTVTPGDFAVACTNMPDGTGRAAWVGYEVFVPSNRVLGPDLTAVYMTFGGPPRVLTQADAS